MSRVDIGSFIESFQNLGEKTAIHCLDRFLYPGDSLYVHNKTGLVSSGLTRSPEEILDYWSKIIFTSKSTEDYSAFRPFAIGRLTYVVRFLLDYIAEHPECTGDFFCDFATGQGVLPRIMSVQPETRNWNIGCTEGSQQLYQEMQSAGYASYYGMLGDDSLEDFIVDYASLTWTLCNCIKPLDVLLDVRKHIKNDGLLVVAESSRLLVPFKKSLSDLLTKLHPADTHPFYWSKNSLSALLKCAGFEPVAVNRYFDSDVLVIIAKKNKSLPDIKEKIEADDTTLIENYFHEYVKQNIYFESLR
jgi:hypothetical protein